MNVVMLDGKIKEKKIIGDKTILVLENKQEYDCTIEDFKKELIECVISEHFAVFSNLSLKENLEIGKHISIKGFINSKKEIIAERITFWSFEEE